MGDTDPQSKADLRAQMREALAAMDEAERHDASVAACNRLLSLDAVRNATVIMLYMPLATEVDLTPAAVRIFQTGRTVCVPKVDWNRKDMTSAEVTSFDDHVMEVDEHGLRSPRAWRPILPSLIDAVIVPALAYDPSGNRLGRGGGYYDRFLQRLRPAATTIGIAFDLQIVDSVPADDRDIAVEMIVTDRRVIQGNRRQPSGIG